jgi:hypothetical protein
MTTEQDRDSCEWEKHSESSEREEWSPGGISSASSYHDVGESGVMGCGWTMKLCQDMICLYPTKPSSAWHRPLAI